MCNIRRQRNNPVTGNARRSCVGQFRTVFEYLKGWSERVTRQGYSAPCLVGSGGHQQMLRLAVSITACVISLILLADQIIPELNWTDVTSHADCRQLRAYM